MWIALGSIVPLTLMLAVVLWKRPRKANLASPLVEELRQGLPHFEVDGKDDSGIIWIKHAFGTWFIHAIRLSKNATLFILRPPEYLDDDGAVVYPESPVKCVVDSPIAARRLGRQMVTAVRDSNDALRVVMSFAPNPQYS
ncbi:MAG: hypothetical protein O7G85_04010 [Planctomycetota bacterium]|nr:hypothetical protein [Planctomycetota bacterium]